MRLARGSTRHFFSLSQTHFKLFIFKAFDVLIKTLFFRLHNKLKIHVYINSH